MQNIYEERREKGGEKGGMHTAFVIILQRSMYFSAVMTSGASRELNPSNDSKKYEYAVL